MAKLFLMEFNRETFGGGDGRAINRHSVREYLSSDGQRVSLDRTLDMVPPHYEIDGPVATNFTGLVPGTKVDGERYFGPKWGWNKAEKKLCEVLDAEIIKPLLFLHKFGKLTNEQSNYLKIYTFKGLRFECGNRNNKGWTIQVVMPNNVLYETFQPLN